MTIESWVKMATATLNDVGIPSARLDAELILARALSNTDNPALARSFLHAHPEMQLQVAPQLEVANAFLARRKNREPLAYIFGTKEFYGRGFAVNKNVLIPRQESEETIHIAKNLAPKNARIIDVGTGSGCLGITLKLELPTANVTLADISDPALSVAKKNTKNLGADVNIIKSDLLTDVTEQFDIIIANLPYVDRKWEVSAETTYEPSLAIFADDDGEKLYKVLFGQSPNHLPSGGYLIIEADPRSHENLIKSAKDSGLEHIQTTDFILVFAKK